jgi:nucleoside phosphorylase
MVRGRALDTLKTLTTIVAATLFAISPLHADTAVFVALPCEQDALRREVRLVGRPVELAGHRISIGYRRGEKVYIVRTGAGVINTTMTTQAVLTRYKVDRVISIGVAGNLNDSWKVGDVLIAADVINHQQGKETPAGFEMREQQPSAISRQLSADDIGKCEELRKAATEVTSEILRSPRKPSGQAQNDNKGEARTNDTTETLRQAQRDNVSERLKADSREPKACIREGRLVSGDSFIASSAKRKWLRETFKADAVDMVSATTPTNSRPKTSLGLSTPTKSRPRLQSQFCSSTILSAQRARNNGKMCVLYEACVWIAW